ncbi:peptidoglycan recognition family protein [Streptacidiphilus sp. N1-10]|uniref:N-acetylmuramoyl-L-alanine amidase n=1 Tax=Streptacidiphilus jeojiensis TaxID=3229225 RepID=A0ABV6XIG8_9ACTN
MAEAAPTKSSSGTGADASTVALATSGKSTLQDEFAAAAAEFKVPESILLAVSYQETQWESHQGQPSTTGNYNVMGLTQVTESTAAPLTAAEGAAEDDEAGDGSKPRTPNAALMALVNDRSASKAPALHTLDTAAGLIKQPASVLRSDSKQSIRGAAALLVSYQTKLKHTPSSDPADWFGAVAAYSQATDQKAATGFADQVFLTIHSGASRTTTDNQTVTLAASPTVTVPTTSTATQAISGLSLRAAAVGTSATTTPECPKTVTCTFVPANANNYYAGNRPTDGNGITTIVLHTTEGASASSAISEFQNASDGTSAHYIVDATGAVTQMVPLESAAIHAANKSINLHSVGIENVGFAGGGSAANNTAGTWIAQPQYLTDAALVSYVAALYNIPLDRDHILGHDDAAYALTSTVGSQHWDPGAYFDWSYFLSLLGATPQGSGTLVAGGTVTIAPAYSTAGAPALTGCDTTGGGGSDACPAHAANFVYLYKDASTSSGLINDAVLTTAGMASGTTEIADVSDKAVYGQTFVVAAVNGDWTAIWYGGQKAWFYNPNGINAVANTHPGQTVIVPKSGTVPVYGRYYPEASDYPASVSFLADPAKCPNQVVAPLAYTISNSQAYTADAAVAGDYYADTNTFSSTCPAPTANTEIISQTKYYPIRFNHRIAYVKAADVNVIQATAPPKGAFVPVTPTRFMDTRTTTGGAKAPVVAGKPRVLTVAGVNGIPSSGVTAVVMNVTAVKPTHNGAVITVYPDGRPQPLASNLNVPAGAVMPNLAIVPVVDGKVDFSVNSGSVDLVADVTGYYSTTATGGSTFTSAGPTRFLDTRTTTGGAKAPVVAGTPRVLTIAGANGLPSTGVTAVVMNVTAVKPTHDGAVITVYPDGQKQPLASNLNVPLGAVMPNLAIVPVVDGKVDFSVNAGSVDLVADVTGYFTQGSGSSYVTAGPVRAMDTRNGTGGVPVAKVGAQGVVKLKVAGVNGLPSTGVTAVVMNVTAVNSSAGGVVTVYPDGSSLPKASNLNFTTGQTIPNLVVVPVHNGVVDFYNLAGTVDLVADVTGYFTQ